LAASEGEGFGLPIIEAARHGLPVLARDIPIFKEVGGRGASYFSADTPEALARFIKGWLLLEPAVRRPEAEIEQLTWQQSADQIWSGLVPVATAQNYLAAAPKNTSEMLA
jgi:glycosyltransferase involved in cell wall biosynthesis